MRIDSSTHQIEPASKKS